MILATSMLRALPASRGRLACALDLREIAPATAGPASPFHNLPLRESKALPAQRFNNLTLV